MTTAVAERVAGPTLEAGVEAAPQPYHWTVEAYHCAGDAGVFGHEAKLELVFGRVIDRFGEAGPADYHWTVDALHRAIDAGVFKEPMRLELVHGRILERMAQGALHLSRRVRIGRRLRSALEPRLFVVDECSLILASDGEVVVDVAVLGGRDGDYDEQNPTSQDVVLVVEVAVSSADHDLGEKSLLYAQAGVGDYWVVLPERNQVVVHRTPTSDGYASVVNLDEQDAVSPLAASDITLTVRDLLGTEAAPAA